MDLRGATEMAKAVVGSPPLDADVAILVDWLELVAFFSRRSVARLDEIDNALTIQEEEDSFDDASADAERDERRERIEGEITERAESLGEAYPFFLSDDGEELRLRPRGQRIGACFYLICLILSHVTRSPILEVTPGAGAIALLRRRHFQALSTMAVAGHVAGPAISFGWPRPGGVSIADAIARACALSGTGLVRSPPGPVASRYVKDGGMDVIAWRPAVGGNPPPAEMCFGQAASGHGWPDKNAPDEVEDFYESFYLDRPACATVGVTIIPFRLGPDDYAMHGRRHGSILDRLRTPKAALDGLRLACDDGVVVDEIERVPAMNLWLIRYRELVRQAA
jgi:hypothetical protein